MISPVSGCGIAVDREGSLIYDINTSRGSGCVGVEYGVLSPAAGGESCKQDSFLLQ
ncbi:hypothetical protein RUMHYD_03519 [Blautia hydrogenotrophica DSM 10507]|uniref:Uncharacterized protein n=1 Tax=Blautia hydrogenotrophica (strain DSM 10507 / JCM 14656 / S5a33) TaxID=476272 RepID=C0CRK5_BLAHS|nr:hypothetical protein RUMHYD_03519 [Blautia hydrogenotrophica DSM 10507]